MSQVIDFHTHIFPDSIAERTIAMLEEKGGIPAYTNGTEEGLLRSMDEADFAFLSDTEHEGKQSPAIRLSVVLPVVTRPTQFETINRFAVQLNQRSERLLSFGGIHPDNTDYKDKLKQLAALGLKGIKLHPDYQGVYFDDIRYLRIIDAASELGLIVSVHTGLDVAYPKDIHATPKRIRKLLKEIQPQKLILAHYGGLFLWDEVEEYLVGEKVYFDTAVINDKISKEQFLRILKNHGSERILFASDSPWSSQKRCCQWLEEMELLPKDKENIMYKNAERLLFLNS